MGGGEVPPNILSDPPYTELPDPPTLQTDPTFVPNAPADISNRPPLEPEKYPSIDLADHLMFIPEPPFTNSITAMHVLHDSPDTITNPRETTLEIFKTLT